MNNIIGYRIDASDDGINFETIVEKQTPTYFTHGELPPGATKYYRIYSIDEDGIISDTYISGSATGIEIRVPDAPRNFTVESVEDTSIELDWDAPSNNGGSPITGYRIDVSTDGGTIFKTIVKSQTPEIFQNLELVSGDTYCYRVYTINKIGISNYYGEGCATVDNDVLGKPTNLIVNGSGSTSIELSWNPPSHDGGDTVTGYRIDVSTDGDSYVTLESSYGDTFYEHSNLESGDTRWYRVYSVNSIGTSLTFASGNATTFTVPNSPIGFIISVDGYTSLTLSWSVPFL